MGEAMRRALFTPAAHLLQQVSGRAGGFRLVSRYGRLCRRQPGNRGILPFVQFPFLAQERRRVLAKNTQRGERPRAHDVATVHSVAPRFHALADDVDVLEAHRDGCRPHELALTRRGFHEEDMGVRKGRGQHQTGQAGT
jgi:hypothetical protein